MLFVVRFLLTGFLAWRYSPTLDEVAQLPAGLAWHRFGRTDLYRVNPPLVRILAAWPVQFLPHRENWVHAAPGSARRTEWIVGSDFVEANGPAADWLFTVARWACLPFSLLGLWVCWRWGTELFGAPGGLAAAALWAFSPNTLGHGSLITCDIAATSCGLLAAWRFSVWSKSHCWKEAFIAGLALGLALLAKSYWILLLGWWPIAAIVTWMGGGKVAGGKVALQLLLVLVMGLNFLNLGYGFQGTGRALGSLPFYSWALSGECRELELEAPANRFSGSWFAQIPLPLPADYITGIDLQKLDFEKTHLSYLAGEVRQGGWWYYYLIGLLVKVPLGTWGLVLLGIGTALRDPQARRRWQELLPWWGPVLTLFVLASLHSGMSRHVRYVFPVLPLLYFMGSESFVVRGRRWPWGLVAATVLESLIWYPGSLSFCQGLAWRGDSASPVLVDSNLDWGQDLRLVAEWLKEHPDRRPATVAAVSGFPVRAVGIDVPFTPVGKTVSGWHLISVHLLHVPENSYSSYRKLRPVGRVGTTFNIYHVSEDLDGGEPPRPIAR